MILPKPQSFTYAIMRVTIRNSSSPTKLNVEGGVWGRLLHVARASPPGASNQKCYSTFYNKVQRGFRCSPTA